MLTDAQIARLTELKKDIDLHGSLDGQQMTSRDGMMCAKVIGELIGIALSTARPTKAKKR